MNRLCATLLASALIAPVLAPAASADDKTLYQRLGGYDAIAAVTDGFIAQLIEDPNLSVYFVGLSTDSKKHLRQNVVDFVCEAAGGPCFYLGVDIEDAHAGLGITAEQWQKSLALLGETMSSLNVPEQEQKDLAAMMDPLRRHVVEKP